MYYFFKKNYFFLVQFFLSSFQQKEERAKLDVKHTHTHTPCTNVKVLPLSNENCMVLSKLECSLRPYTIVLWPFQHMSVK
jgi:hypothetical protein